jgi:hypothetical protein
MVGDHASNKMKKKKTWKKKTINWQKIPKNVGDNEVAICAK